MFRIELEQLNEMNLEYECQLEMLNQKYQQTKTICDQLVQSWEGASKEQFASNAEQTLYRFRLFMMKMERMKEVLKETAIPEINRELNRCEGFSDVLSSYYTAEPSEDHSPFGTLYLDDSFIAGIEGKSAEIGYEATKREQMLWNQAMECLGGGLKFTSLNFSRQDQEFCRYVGEQSDFILQFRESFHHYHQNIELLEERLSADFEEIAEIQTADISGRSYEALIERDWSRELIRLGGIVGKMVTNGEDMTLLTAGSGKQAVTASIKLSEEWSKDLKGIGSLLTGVLVEQTRYADVSSLAWGTFGSNLLMDLLLSTQWGKNKEEELINRYLNKEQYYLGKLTVDIAEEQQSRVILETADGIIEFIRKNPWISGLFGAGAGGAGMGMAQTTAGTVELTVSGASAVAAIEIVAAGAVIGTLAVAAAAHNNPKSQELQDENSEKIEELGEGGSGAGKYKLTDNLKAHIEDVDVNVPRKRGIGGAHKKDVFMQNDIKIISETPNPNIDGVTTIEYQMPKLDKTGTPIPGEYQSGVPKVKTVYDSNIISTDDYLNKGLQAANNAASQSPNGVLSREWVGVDNNGVTWRGYFENGEITSMYPEY